MTPNNPDWVVVGQFGRVHGIQGFVRVYAYSNALDQLLRYEPWFMWDRSLNTWVPLKRLAEKLSSTQLLVKIDGYAVREQAALLTHRDIAVLASQLPALPSDEYYCFELIGMDVYTLQKRYLGRVTQLLETGANDVLVVEGDERHLIPYLPQKVIHSVSRATHQLIVDWEGEFL